MGALSCNRVIQAAAPALSYWPRLQAAGPACTAAAAVHAGSQGVPWGAWAWLTSPQASGAKSIGETQLKGQKEKDLSLNKHYYCIYFYPNKKLDITVWHLATITQDSVQEMKSSHKFVQKRNGEEKCKKGSVTD